MTDCVHFIGYGEAARAFVEGWGDARPARITAHDIRPKQAETARDGVTLVNAATDAPLILCVVTADQALSAAQAAAATIAVGALYCDMNSIAPDTKRAAAAIIEAVGGRYVDVAVMSPVRPALSAAPLLVSGPHADAAAKALAGTGFSHIRTVGDAVGRASSIKMIRSVIVKGIEALTAECVLAADRAGVIDEVLGSLGTDWPGKADYNLDRMMIHGLRRAAEMDEVVETLDALGTGSAMTRGTVTRQRAIGSMGFAAAPEGLAAKIEAITEREAQAA